MVRITTCLWFDNNLEEALAFYRTVFKSVEMGKQTRGPEGELIAARFTIDDNQFEGINGGPMFKFSEAISLSIACRDQAEVDHYWNGLLADGGQESQCGWLRDKFGLSWQIVPDAIYDTVSGPDPEGAARAMAAMLKMVKLDVAALEAAYAGR